MRTSHYAIAALLLSSISISAQNIKVSVSRGISSPISQSSDSLHFQPQNILKTSVYIPLAGKGWSEKIAGREMSVTFGVNIGGGLISEQKTASTSGFNAFGIAESTSSKLFVRNDDTSKKKGYNLEIAPQLSFLLGDFEFAPIVGLGYLKTVQKAFTVEQNIPNGTYPTYVKIFNRPETTNSGFMISPKFRVSYTPGIIGLWVEGDYVAGPEMVSRTYQLIPSGRPGSDGIYKSEQLLTGSTKEIVRKTNYGAFGVYAGISVSLNKKKKGKPYMGQDDDCDGLAIVTESSATKNGQMVVRRIVKSQTKGNTANDIISEESTKSTGINPFYNGQSQSGENPLYNGLNANNSASCGPVTQKTIKPDGTIEEMTFACPDDAIYFNSQNENSNTEKKQTQGATFGEKVNQGLHAAGSALSQGASLVGGALPGGAVISAKLASGNSMPNRISMNVTVAKQTQGATFGERVTGATTGTIHISLTDEGCVVFMPDNATILVNARKQNATELNESESNTLRNKLKARQALLEKSPNTVSGSLPGGSIISAAVSSVSNLAGSGGGAAAASYAATGRVGNTGNQTATTELPDNDCDGLVTLSDGEYEISFKVVEKATSGLKDTLKTQVRIGFTVQGNTLKTKHDTAKNSVGNIR